MINLEKSSLNLYKKLNLIRTQISIKKTGNNNFGKYKYYEIDEIYAQAKVLFAEYGIFTKFDLIFDPVEIGEEEITLEKGTKKKKKVGIYRATLTIINSDNPHEYFTMKLDSPLNETPGCSPAQQVGSNNTYQLKYLYLDLLMIDDGASDPDSKNNFTQNKRN